MAYNTRPTIRSRLLGTKLRRARKLRGLSVEEVAARAKKAASSVYRNESGHTPPKGKALSAYVTLYQPDFAKERADWIAGEVARFDESLARVDQAQASPEDREAIQRVRDTVAAQAEAQVDAWIATRREEWAKEVSRWQLLSKESGKRGPWAESGRTVGPSYQDFAEAEAMAEQIYTWSAQAIPGLLQTKTYSEGVIRPAAEAYPVGAYPVDHLLTLREQRKGLLTRRQLPEIHAVVDEAALMRLVGGPDVMQEQFRHLLMLVETKGLHLQVLPFAAGGHTGLSGAFDLFGFGPDTMVFREGHGDGTFIDDDEQVHLYQARYQLLQDQAWSSEETLGYLQDVLTSE